MGTLLTFLRFLPVLALLSSEAPVELRATPKTGFAPMTIKVTTVVPRHADNRFLCLSLDGDSYSTSSCVSMEGAKAPRTTERYYSHLPSGNYLLQAYIIRSDNRTHFATPLTLSVIGP